MAAGREIILEVHRRGRRPRYHRGVQQDGDRLDRPQCNVDQAGAGVRTLRNLPEVRKGSPMQRPWAQLCRRCWAGSRVLAAADEQAVAQLQLAAVRREERKAYRAMLAERKAAREGVPVAP